MILRIYTVYDSKVEAYMSPFYCRTDGEAIRAIVAQVRNPEHSFSKFPEDYTLFFMGEFDDQKGRLDPATAPKALGTLLEWSHRDQAMNFNKEV